MKNFNNNDIQKYEKILKSTFSKFQTFNSFKNRLPRISYSHILITICMGSLCYIGYRAYDYRKYRRQHYIDLFKWKQNLGDKISQDDVWQKIKNLDFYNNKQQPTKIYQNMLKQQFQKFIIDIQSKKIYYEQSEEEVSTPKNQRIKKQKENKKNIKQLILSKNYKSKLDLGYFFKLHTKQYVNSISNNGNYIKKTYIIPIMLFNIPFFVTKKQEVKKIGKKGKFSNLIAHKGKFELSSQCQKINYWNILLLKQKKNEEQVLKNQNTQKIECFEDRKIEDKQSQKSKQQQTISKSTQRKQILFQCRKRIKQVQQQLKQNLKSVIDDNWQNKHSKKQFIDNNTFKLQIWQDNQQSSH